MADYRKYVNDIERSEFKNFYPISKQHLNEPTSNKRNFQFYISGTLTKQDGTQYTAAENVKLIDNFVPFLFTKIEVRKHNKILEEVENCGQLSTIKGTISYSKKMMNFRTVLNRILNLESLKQLEICLILV